MVYCIVLDCPTTVPLIENECNKCYCTKDGELACTINEWLVFKIFTEMHPSLVLRFYHFSPENRGKNLENCTVGTSWRQDCNKCWCITIGTVCTNYECKN